eukprot:gb/GEZN01000013.1/.p1 GENE.gb/GEZN01000013.1/~~gb/GEZN01000013.1/.p1  ORF type:complete len:4868 (+),score=291.58 gb/GEZN01000013.1/:91-14694(+)
MVAMISLCWCLAILANRVSGTHWAYGSSKWALEPTNTNRNTVNTGFSNVPGNDQSRKSYKFDVKMGWRWSYAWGPANPPVGNTVLLKGCQPTARLRFFKQGSCDRGILDPNAYSFNNFNSNCCHNYGPGPSCQSNSVQQSPMLLSAYDNGPPSSTRMGTFPSHPEQSETTGQRDRCCGLPADYDNYQCKSTDISGKQSQTLAASATGKYDITLTVTDTFSTGDWFLGVSEELYVFNVADATYAYNIEFYYEDCCRLSDPHAGKAGIKNGNNDQWFRIQGVIARTQSRSPEVQGTARVRLRENTLNKYFLFATHAQGNVLEYKWTGLPKSRLVTQKPLDTGSSLPNKEMSLDEVTGIATWYPTATARGLYAVSFAIVDTGHPAVAPGQPVPTPIPLGERSWIPLDFIFEVSPDAGPYFTHPFHEYDPLYDTPDERVIYFNVNNEKTYVVCSRDDTSTSLTNPPHMIGGAYIEDNPITFVRGRAASALSSLGVEVQNPSGKLPTYSRWLRYPGFTDGSSNPMCWSQTWRPGYGDTDQVATYISYNTPSLIQSIGLYQLKLVVVTDILYVSGVIRDFHNNNNNLGHPDFDIACTYPSCTGFDLATVNDAGADKETTVGLVQRKLSANGKPLLRTINSPVFQKTSNKVTNRTFAKMPPPLPPVTQENCNGDGTCQGKGGFYDWFVTDEIGINSGLPVTKLINMQRVYSVALAKINETSNVFTYFAGTFYPIDGQLLGNEGDPNNRFFTWEIKTFLTYTPGDKLTYQSMDDMWVFVDGILPVGWTLGGIPPALDPAIVPRVLKSYTINLNSVTPALSSGLTYRVDIFYAHRADRDPGIKIELPDFSICDGLTTGTHVIDIQAFTVNDKYQLAFGNDINDNNFFEAQVSLPNFATTYDSLKLLRKADTKSSVWFHENPSLTPTTNRVPTLVKLLNGFRTTFNFIVKCTPPASSPSGPCAEGFAFVLHRNDNAFLGGGSSGSGLGYAGTSRVFAIEFDMYKTDNVDFQTYGWVPTLSWSEISFHTRYFSSGVFPAVDKVEDPINSQGANTNVENGLPLMHFSNGSFHSVKIEYQTGRKDTSGAQQPGYIRVYMNQNLAPVAEAQIESPALLDQLLGGAAYIGFTAANSASRTADIYITNWDLVLVTTSAANTIVVFLEDIVAGNTGCALIQAKDICDKDIVVGGEGAKFRAKYSRVACPTPQTSGMVYDRAAAADADGYQPIDNGNGTYTFCYDPTKAGVYTLDITFDGQKINKGLTVNFQVYAAPVSPSKSKFRLPLPSMPWEYNMAGIQKGIYARIFTGHGLTLPASEDPGTEDQHVFASLSTLQTYLNKAIINRDQTPGLSKKWITIKSDLVAFALVGFTNIDLNGLLQATRIPNECFGGTVPSSIPNNQAWACIVEKTNSGFIYKGPAAPKNFAYVIGETGRDADGNFRMYYEGLDQRTSFTRKFIIAAESGTHNPFCGSYGRIGSFQQDLPPSHLYRVPANSFNPMTIEAVDDYGNLDTRGITPWVVNFPDYPVSSTSYSCGDGTCNTLVNGVMLGLESCITCGDRLDCEASDCPYDYFSSPGYYRRALAGNRAGIYALYVSLPAGNLGITDCCAPFGNGTKSPFGLVIEPGPACLIPSTLLGTGINPTAGIEVQPIEVKLKDCAGNFITRDREEDVISAQLVASGTSCPSTSTPGCESQPVTFQWVRCNADNECVLEIKYTPYKSTLFAGKRNWNIVFDINGQKGSKGTPIVQPNAWSPQNSTAVVGGLQPCQPDAQFGALVYAGKPFQCMLQSIDAYGNDRWGDNFQQPVSNGNGLYVAVPTSPVDGSQVVYANGDGQYFLSFTPKTASTTKKDLKIAISGVIGGQTQYLVGSPLSFTVLPGDPDARSILAARTTSSNYPPNVSSTITLAGKIKVSTALSCSSSVCEFVIVSYDKESNLRYNAFGQRVISDDDYAVNVITHDDPPQTGFYALTGNASSTGVFTYNFHQSAPIGFYKLEAKTKQGVSLVNSPFGTTPGPPTDSIYIDPSEPFGPNTEVSGSGLVGCIENKLAYFLLTPYDFWGNKEIVWSMYPIGKIVVALNISASPTPVVSQVASITEGGDTLQRYDTTLVYNVTYICPTVAGGGFEISLMFTNPTTQNAECSSYEELTQCSQFCAGQTFGQCGKFKVIKAISYVGEGTSYASLEVYQARPTSNTLLRVGQATNPLSGATTTIWWYIQNREKSGVPKSSATDIFSVELTSVADRNMKITIPSSQIRRDTSDLSKYWVSFLPVERGVFTAKVLYQGVFYSKDWTDESIWQSNNITILIGEVDPNLSDVAWTGIQEVQAGSAFSFTVQLVDQQRNVHSPGYCPPLWNPSQGVPIAQTTNCDFTKATFEGPVGNPNSLTQDCIAAAGNKYSCSVTLTVAGIYFVKVTTHLGNTICIESACASNNFRLNVIAGPPSPSKSFLIMGAEPHVYLAGVSLAAEMDLRDEYNNPASIPATFNDQFKASFLTGTGTVVLVMSTPSSGFGLPSKANLMITPRRIANNTRTYNAVSQSWSAGSNQLKLEFNSIVVTGTSSGASNGGYYTLVVGPGTACSENTCQAGRVSAILCPSTAIAGQTLNLTLVAYDIEGNRWRGENKMEFPFKYLSPSSGSGYESIKCSTTSPGEFYIKFQKRATTQANSKLANGTIASKLYEFEVTLEAGVTVTNQNAGQQCIVSPSNTDVESSQLYYLDVEGLSSTFKPRNPENIISYVITPKDQYGNFRTGSNGETFVMGFDEDAGGGAVKCPSDTGIQEAFNPVPRWTTTTPVWNAAKGGFVYNATTTLAGVFTVSMTLNSVAASCSARKSWVQTICSGAPDGSSSYFSLDFDPATSNIVAGTKWAVETFLLDQWSNPVVGREGCPALSAAVRIDNGDNAPAGAPSTVSGINISHWIRNVPTDPACTTLFREPCAHPQTIVQLQTSAEGATRFEINATQARDYALVPSIFSSGAWTALQRSASLVAANWDQILTVVAAPARRFSLTDNNADDFNSLDEFIGTAAIPSSFVLFPADWWLNPINDNSNFEYSVRFDSGLVDYGFKVLQFTNYFAQGGAEVAVCNGTCEKIGTRASYLSSWHGPFSISASIRPKGTSVSTWSETLQKKIYHATCQAEYPALKFRCADLPFQRHTATCKANYADCLALDGDTDVNKVRCANGAYKTDPMECPCVTGSRLPTGVCYSSGTRPPEILSPCPTDTKPCPLIRSGSQSISAQCRKNLAECPSVRQCPPGFVVCNDGVTCARIQGPGPVCPPLLTCLQGQIPCWDGHCRSAAEDCPTPVTCADPTHVVCSDGSCSPSRAQCPDRYNCFLTGAQLGFACPDGSCRSSRDGCPSKVTCPAGQLLCESGACVAELVHCPRTVACLLNQTRCPDGSCHHNLLFCPAEVTCKPDVPVRCPDGQCVTSVSNCATPPVCPKFRCSDGYCVEEYINCPTPKACPIAKPVLCQDGGCVVEATMCSFQQPCPPEAPTRCPDNACRTNILLCPTHIVCPAEKPVKCSDNQCSVALEACGPAPECTDTRCPGGECAMARDLCPTHVTCPYYAAPVRCLDGTCRTSLAECPTYSIEPCHVGYITCPRAGTGIPVCATRLENCPTNMVCPIDRQVRCMDSSCAPSTDDCPSIPVYPVNEVTFVPCADGTWATTAFECPKPVTCRVPETPYKCWDGSCRVSPQDCPTPSGCTGGYQCPNGACTELPWSADCRPAAVPCVDPSEIKCEDGKCYASGELNGVALCPIKYITPVCMTCDPVNYCPYGQPNYCRDGSCRKSADDCQGTHCSGSLPFLCDNGACVAKQTDCLTSEGCPPDKNIKCQSGMCAAVNRDCIDEFTCPPEKCDAALLPSSLDCTYFDTFTAKCDEGSCADNGDSNNCPETSGCFKTNDITPKRCADGSCVLEIEQCVAGDSVINICPPQSPYRCSDGFCAISSSFCPIPTYSAGCSGGKPIQCAAGTCAAQDIACPIVKQCRADEMRCGDGSCRLLPNRLLSNGAICPQYDSCPKGTARCRSGLCSPVDGLGKTTSCNTALNGCPVGQSFKCPSGVCAAYEAECPTDIPAPNGCAVKVPNPFPGEGPVKCSDGSCADKISLCPLGNGCKLGEVKCSADGKCLNATMYNPATSCQQCPAKNVICPDGTCKLTSNLCTSAGNGCPLATPFRCADGTCAAYAAGTQLPPDAPAGLKCMPRVVCSTGRALCADGSCAATTSLCPTVAPCDADKIFCTLNWTCTAPAICDPAIITPKCSQAQPLLCPSGECRTSIDECTGGMFGGGKPAPPCPLGILCFNGACVATMRECLDAKASVFGSSFDQNQALETQFCKEFGANIMCADGRCVADSSYCSIIAACPVNQARCRDGSCATEEICKGIIPGKCATGKRCEDGMCRSKCLEYDGCGINSLGFDPVKPFLCADRECVTSSGVCKASQPQAARRTLAQTGPPPPCYSNCFSQIKAQVVDISINSRTTTASKYTIAKGSLGEQVMTLQIPSGAVTFTNTQTQDSILSIRPVGESRMRGAVNPIHISRRRDPVFMYPDVMSFAQTVLSPAFECYVTADVTQPFQTNLTVVSSIDASRFISSTPFVPDDLAWIQDACLAKLVVRNGYSFWSCLWGQTELRRLICQEGLAKCVVGTYTAGLIWDPQANSDLAIPQGDKPWKGASTFNRCIQDEGVEVGLAATGVIYAFISNPLKVYNPPPPPPEEPASLVLYILFGALALLVIICCGFYIMFRLSRYRKKYKTQKAEADRLAEEMENMEHFGVDAAGLKAGDVIMQPNPLAQQISHLSAAVDESEIKLQQAEQQLKMDEAGVRAGHIENMKANRDKMLADLARLKEQLAATQDQHGGPAQVQDNSYGYDGSGTNDWGNVDGDTSANAQGDFTATAPNRRNF